MEEHWEHFPHDADMGVRGVGPTKERAFELAATALTALTTDHELVEARESVEVTCRAPDDEQLLVEWLDAIIFELATRNMVFGRFEVRFAGETLEGRLWGEPRRAQRHTSGVEVKGATFTELRVTRQETAWVAQCIVDL